jgi:hypothetical protein
MPQESLLSLSLHGPEGQQALHVLIRNLIVAGWVGRDRQSVQEHVEEMQRFGIPPPERTPTYMNLTTNLLTTSEILEVISPSTSGEVEAVLIRANQCFYLGLGSDHTDRELEKTDIPASKQVCGKVLSPEIWDYQEIEDHLDQLRLRSWVVSGQEERLYQEAPLAANLPPGQLFEDMPGGQELKDHSICLFCGTFPTISGIQYGDRYIIELEDPVLDRRIRHGYTVKILPQYL